MTQQLQMIWDRSRAGHGRRIDPGYALRGFRSGDEEAYIKLMNCAGFNTWSRDHLNAVLKNAVPNGIVFAEHIASSRIAATAMGWYKPSAILPDAYEMGWVAADPEHRGKGLGQCVVAAVTQVLAEHGEKTIYLLTDDWRLPAIKGYLLVGYVPLYHAPDMKKRWADVFLKLNLDPEKYPGIGLGWSGEGPAANNAPPPSGSTPGVAGTSASAPAARG